MRGRETAEIAGFVALLACAWDADLARGGEGETPLPPGAAAPSEPAVPGDATTIPSGETLPPTRWDTHGTLSLRYRYRLSHGEEDEDLYQYGYFAGERIEDGKTKFEWLFDGLVMEDLDRFESTGGSIGSNVFPFTDAGNTFGERVHGYLYEGYLEVYPDGPISSARLGRQSIYREDGIVFDGLRLRGPSGKPFVLEAYGGLPTHFYESSPSGDFLGGVGARVRPVEEIRIGLDWVYIRDRIRDANDPSDRLTIGSVEWRPLANLRAGARASFIDARDRRQELSLHWRLPATGLEVRTRAVRQNSFVTFYTNEFSPYIQVEGKYAPYFQWDLDVAQPFATYFEVGGGTRIRELLDESDEGIFNREFRNGHGWLAFGELVPGMRFEARVDVWDANQGSIVSEGVSLRQDFGRTARAEIGTEFALYRFDPWSGTEREEDRVHYGSLEWFFLEWLSACVRYEYERDAEREYHGVDTSVTLRF